MAVRLYNTLTRRLETFKPLQPPKVGLYSCGPTVYGRAHIGNLRTFIVNDVLKRVLLLAGYEVNHVTNITDVDDKTIAGAKQAGQTLTAFTRRYEDLFRLDLLDLGILPMTAMPRATEHIAGMITLIEELIKREAAYVAEGGVYFRLAHFPTYARLAHLPALVTQVSRVNQDGYDKEEVGDFALWKFRTPEDGAVFYEASFGAGRPGWHIECAAMALQYLGQTVDIHTGGLDLIFPHHTNEIAEAETITGETFARYWLHIEFVKMASEKMSKSLGNTITLEEIKKRDFTARAYRYLVLGTHYRQPLNFTWEALAGARQSLNKLKENLADLNEASGSTPDSPLTSPPEVWRKKLNNFLFEDLNTPRALALIWDGIKSDTLTPAEKVALALAADEVLGLDFRSALIRRAVPPEVISLAKERETARKNNDWTKADELRQKISQFNYQVDDTPRGPRLRYNQKS